MHLVVVTSLAIVLNLLPVNAGGNMGLYPFPRVGRAYHTWKLNPEGLYNAGTRESIKRQGLIPFPRVGRSQPSTGFQPWQDLMMNRQVSFPEYPDPEMMSPEKRGQAGDVNAMWFGPRLGRVSKRFAVEVGSNDRDGVWSRADGESDVAALHHFTPKDLQTEDRSFSEETQNAVTAEDRRKKRQTN